MKAWESITIGAYKISIKRVYSGPSCTPLQVVGFQPPVHYPNFLVFLSYNFHSRNNHKVSQKNKGTTTEVKRTEVWTPELENVV